MDSESSAFITAQSKHHRYMMYFKKQRYIEVFQCSGEDMNLVLTGNLSPKNNNNILPTNLHHHQQQAHQQAHHQQQGMYPTGNNNNNLANIMARFSTTASQGLLGPNPNLIPTFPGGGGLGPQPFILGSGGLPHLFGSGAIGPQFLGGGVGPGAGPVAPFGGFVLGPAQAGGFNFNSPFFPGPGPGAGGLMGINPELTHHRFLTNIPGGQGAGGLLFPHSPPGGGLALLQPQTATHLLPGSKRSFQNAFTNNPPTNQQPSKRFFFNYN